MEAKEANWNEICLTLENNSIKKNYIFRDFYLPNRVIKCDFCGQYKYVHLYLEQKENSGKQKNDLPENCVYLLRYICHDCTENSKEYIYNQELTILGDYHYPVNNSNGQFKTSEYKKLREAYMNSDKNRMFVFMLEIDTQNFTLDRISPYADCIMNIHPNSACILKKKYKSDNFEFYEQIFGIHALGDCPFIFAETLQQKSEYTLDKNLFQFPIIFSSAILPRTNCFKIAKQIFEQNKIIDERFGVVHNYQKLEFITKKQQ